MPQRVVILLKVIWKILIFQHSPRPRHLLRPRCQHHVTQCQQGGAAAAAAEAAAAAAAAAATAAVWWGNF